jgi:uncharacterized protein YcbX
VHSIADRLRPVPRREVAGRRRETPTTDGGVTPTVSRITVYPVKSLDPLDRERARVVDGALELDREYAVVDAPAGADHDPDTASPSGDGDYVNGKRTDAVHRLRSAFDPDAHTLTLRPPDGESRTFELDDDREPLNEWLSAYFGRRVSVRRADGGHPDHRRSGIGGPSVISTATLREVASWFDDLDVDSVRRRVRANVEVGGVPAFWEDRLYADRGEAVAFRVGDVEFLGVEPCERCVVPSRDPKTGAPDPEFRERFLRRRRETRPSWLDSDRYDHDYRLMVITRVPEREWGASIAVGDEVEVLGVRRTDDDR